MLKLGAFITQKPVVKDFPAYPLIRGAGRYPNGEVESWKDIDMYTIQMNEKKKQISP